MKILILCTGNSCRSQMAHGFMKNFDARLEVYSAGVAPGYRVAPEAVQVMAEKGIDISKHHPHDVREYLEESFDYVITVCDHARESCPFFSGEVKHRLHYPFPDPYHAPGGPEAVMLVYREVRDAIEKKFNDLYEYEIKGKL
ncbi:MAG: arsenate reductase ArsC [Candidatus Neomarinimicrobiota bacterium]|jgi:arsenate reductase|nr:arsenate reductase ArsC [Candidatus Neomarinimicrobiota bacterium]MDD3966269.1 arsenate reductase ArsC [Candidatus Neomarinimicrobiota bacterium]MDX9779743.1 arsenate reductase ArsC [bacterium]